MAFEWSLWYAFKSNLEPDVLSLMCVFVSKKKITIIIIIAME